MMVCYVICECLCDLVGLKDFNVYGYYFSVE